jgi:carbonyl reductase 1
VRAVAARRRARDIADGTLVAAVCPGLVDTRASRLWFDDFSQAQTPTRAAGPILDLVLSQRVDPATYGELVRFGKLLAWRDGTPPRYQDQLLTRQLRTISRYFPLSLSAQTPSQPQRADA